MKFYTIYDKTNKEYLTHKAVWTNRGCKVYRCIGHAKNAIKMVDCVGREIVIYEYEGRPTRVHEGLR